MTQDEIKEALETCILGYCTGCPYDGCDGDCRDELHTDALNLIAEQEKEIERLKAENIRLTTKLGQVLLSIDTVKEMNTMCSIDEQKKQAKIDVLNDVREKYSTFGNTFAGWIAFIPADDIDEMIEELKK